MDIEAKVAVLEMQTQANKDEIVALTQDIKDNQQGLNTKFDALNTSFGTLNTELRERHASEQALAKYKKALIAAIVTLVGLAGAVVSMLAQGPTP